MVYGAVAGGALVALELSVFGVLGVPPSAVDVLGLTLGWGLTLLLATLAGVTLVAGRGVGRSAAVPLVVYHLVYALGLWVWVRATWITCVPASAGPSASSATGSRAVRPCSTR
ncbi:hypothetical protein EGH21_10130 [Halomicroarcula sp. F13]|uniref:Integral membrane protein n=1 Tax=Haloarcula rubra TaxID=2487747 RepID=A0AAW4PRP9_9EURY|nr:hypothetical protein [Halomicroarcula rubra]MBX0323386.1 hypothetical protein [Halomicroarcula rubra]